MNIENYFEQEKGITVDSARNAGARYTAIDICRFAKKYHESELKKAQIALEWFIEKEQLDESACKDQFQKVLEARNKLSTERYNFLIEVRKLLGYERFLQLKPKSYELRKEKSLKDKGRRAPKERGDRS